MNRKQRQRKAQIAAISNPTKTDRKTATFTDYICTQCREPRPFNWFYQSPKDRLICCKCIRAKQ